MLRKTKKKVHVDAVGVAHIKASFNNVLVTITDVYMEILFLGHQLVKTALKDQEKTLHLLRSVTQLKTPLKKRMILGLRRVDVFIKGPWFWS